jgi:SecD/SecF fusion protein
MNSVIAFLSNNIFLLGGMGILAVCAYGLQRLRAPNTTKLVAILALVLLAIGAVKPDFSRPDIPFHKYVLGVDLSGGTILVYNVDTQNKPADMSIDQLVNALKERLDPKGMFNYSIRSLGEDQVEIIMPRAHEEDVDRVKQLISTVGRLQFKMVANTRRHAELIQIADERWPRRDVTTSAVFVRYGVWLPLRRGATSDRDPDQELIRQGESLKPNEKRDVTLENGRSYTIRFVTLEEATFDQLDRSRHVIATGPGGREFVLSRWDDDGVKVGPPENLVKEDPVTGDRYVLMYNDEYDVTGTYLRRVYPTFHEGQLAVGFQFDAEGADKFGNLTNDYRPQQNAGYTSQLGVMLDNRLRSAANLIERISSSGVITLGANATNAEVDRLVKILNAGQLPAAVEKEPASQFQIDATLGSDTIEKGQIAIAVSLVMVVVFMLIYYQAVGFIAVLGLLLNLLFTVALMVLLKATWTLPGLAGLVLTIGMSVDANVLIYERMREEIDRGASLGMAIRNGYGKAWSAILDGNLTTIFSAMILYVIGTDFIRGFAVTLILGLLTSMFCAVFVTRAFFDLLYAKRWLQRLRMLRLLSQPNFDFLRLRRVWAAVSAVVIAIGMIGAAARGPNNFDIDLLGGTMVQVAFREDKPKLDSAQVRELASKELPNVSLESVHYTGEAPGYRYIIRTTEQNGQMVREKIIKAFEEYLRLPRLAVGAERPIGETPDHESLTPLKGGKEFELTLSQPRATSLVRTSVTTVLAQNQPTLANIEDAFAVIPVSAGPVESDSRAEFDRFRLAVAPGVDLSQLVPALQKQVSATAAFDQFNQFGPQVAGETQTRAVWAIALSWLVIIIYVAFRFHSWEFGVAGVVALVHDSLAAIGLTALFSLAAVYVPALEYLFISDMKINLTVIAAVLTLIGYSINDTIVIFDRVREIRGKSPNLTEALFNRSLNETLSRTIITSLTVFMVVVVLLAGGGVTLRGFTFVLLLGLILGTYSTIYIASPVVLLLVDFMERRRKRLQATGRAKAAAAL